MADESALRIESAAVEIADPRRDRRIGWSALAASLLALTLGAPLAAMAYLPAGLVTATAALLGMFAAAQHLATRHRDGVAGRQRHGAGGDLEVSDEGVVVVRDGIVQRFRNDDLVSGWTATVGDAHAIVLQARSGKLVTARVDDLERADAFLRAAGLSAHQRSATLRLGVTERRGSRRVMSALAVVVGLLTLPWLVMAVTGLVGAVFKPWLLGGVAASLLPLTPGLLALGALVLPLVTTRVDIGTDGIAVTRLGKRRFVPLSRTREVAISQQTVIVLLDDDRQERIVASTPDEARMLARRIRAALTTSEDADPSLLERLDRRGRPLQQWFEELRRMVREPGYRSSGLEGAQLLRVVEDPKASAERRIAAAATIAAGDDAELRNRVRVASAACAEPRLRVALERAGEDDLDEELLDEALRAAEPRVSA